MQIYQFSADCQLYMTTMFGFPSPFVASQKVLISQQVVLK